MVCFVAAPSRYLNQCWFRSSGIHRERFHMNYINPLLQKAFWKLLINISFTFPRGQWVKRTIYFSSRVERWPADYLNLVKSMPRLTPKFTLGSRLSLRWAHHVVVTLFSNIIHEQNTSNTNLTNKAYPGYCKHVLCHDQRRTVDYEYNENFTFGSCYSVSISLSLSVVVSVVSISLYPAPSLPVYLSLCF